MTSFFENIDQLHSYEYFDMQIFKGQFGLIWSFNLLSWTLTIQVGIFNVFNIPSIGQCHFMYTKCSFYSLCDSVQLNNDDLKPSNRMWIQLWIHLLSQVLFLWKYMIDHHNCVHQYSLWSMIPDHDHIIWYLMIHLIILLILRVGNCR